MPVGEKNSSTWTKTNESDHAGQQHKISAQFSKAPLKCRCLCCTKTLQRGQASSTPASPWAALQLLSRRGGPCRSHFRFGFKPGVSRSHDNSETCTTSRQCSMSSPSYLIRIPSPCSLPAACLKQQNYQQTRKKPSLCLLETSNLQNKVRSYCRKGHLEKPTHPGCQLSGMLFVISTV